MRNYKLLLLFIPLIFFEFQSITYAQNTPGDVVYDYFLVVDVSGSMEGKPIGSGNVVIFPEVKRKLIVFLENNVRSDSNVVIIPFSRGVEEKQVFFKTPVKSQEDVVELKNRIDSLQAKGQETWIYHALDAALKWSEKLAKQAGSSRKRIQTIYLYTDGLNNGPDSLTLDEILKNFRLRRAETEHLYLKWVTIGGAHQPKEVEGEPGVTTIEVEPEAPVPAPVPPEVKQSGSSTPESSDIEKYIIAGGIGAVILCFLVFLLGRRAGWWQSFGKKVLIDGTKMEIKLKDKQKKNLWFSSKVTLGSRKENIDIGVLGLYATLTIKGGNCRIIPNPKIKGAVKIAENDIDKPTDLPTGSSFKVGNSSFTLEAK